MRVQAMIRRFDVDRFDVDAPGNTNNDSDHTF
jgi:hypothetical protein